MGNYYYLWVFMYYHLAGFFVPIFISGGNNLHMKRKRKGLRKIESLENTRIGYPTVGLFL